MRSLYDVVRRPVISEKSTALAEVAGRYVFEVNRAANKEEIRNAIQKIFKVRVRGVRTMMVPGKIKRVGRSMSKRPSWKKAIVTLDKGQKIELFQTQQ